jgi:hypothetical protein
VSARKSACAFSCCLQANKLGLHPCGETRNQGLVASATVWGRWVAAAWLRSRSPRLLLFPDCIFNDRLLRSYAFREGPRNTDNQHSCRGCSCFNRLGRGLRPRTRGASSGRSRGMGSPVACGEAARAPSGPVRTRAIQSTKDLRGALVTYGSKARNVYHPDDSCLHATASARSDIMCNARARGLHIIRGERLAPWVGLAPALVVCLGAPSARNPARACGNRVRRSAM